MAPAEPTKHHDSAEKQKSLDHEIKELISALTTRLGTIQRPHKPGGSTSNNQDVDDEDEQGVRIITLAGNNLGATMRGDTTTDDKALPVGVGPQDLEQDDFSTYVNSNFQAINNSIMLGGSYRTNDPGVHLDISDNYYQQKGVGKNKKRSSRSDRQVENSDEASDSENS